MLRIAVPNKGSLSETAAEMLAEGVYNRMVAMKGSEVTSVPLEQVAGKIKLVPPDHPLVRSARLVGTNFGD